MVYNIKAVCRDGGAVERARFEIVLCRNVYEGSNPSLCAKPVRNEVIHFHRFFVWNIERDLRVGAVLREQNALP